MGKAATRIGHFLLSLVAGFLVGYGFYSFRYQRNVWEALGAGLIVFVITMILLPRLHRGGGGGGD
jgi:hypothetical protein